MEGHLRGVYEYKDRNVWECLNCGALAIDIIEEQGLTEVKWYLPENKEIGNLFDIGTGEDLIQHLEKEWKFWKKEFLMIEAREI
jgi:hypothetical protein